MSQENLQNSHQYPPIWREIGKHSESLDWEKQRPKPHRIKAPSDFQVDNGENKME